MKLNPIRPLANAVGKAAAPGAQEATKDAAREAAGTLLTPSPGALASFSVLSAAVGTVWTALRHLRRSGSPVRGCPL